MSLNVYHPLSTTAAGILIKIPNCVPMYVENIGDLEVDLVGRHIRVSIYKQRNELGGGGDYYGWELGHKTYKKYQYADTITEPFVHAYPSGTELVELTDAPEWSKFDKEAAEKAFAANKAEVDEKFEQRKAALALKKEQNRAKERADEARRLLEREEALANRNVFVRLYCRVTGK